MMTITPSVIFGLGVVGLIPCVLAHVAIRLVTARWDARWLARQRLRTPAQVEEFAGAFETTARRMTRLLWRLLLLPVVCAVPALSYAGAGLLLGPIPGLGLDFLEMAAFVWIATAPLLGVALLTRSMRLAAGRARQLGAVEVRPDAATQLRRAV